MTSQHHVYLSPHLDDVIFSCGGLIAHRSVNEKIFMETIFAGGDRLNWRRLEDFEAAETLGIYAGHFFYLEAPDRNDCYKTASNLFFEPSLIDDDELVEDISGEIKQIIGARSGKIIIYCPIAIGNHIDHRITRRVAELLRRPLVYYYDMPYASRKHMLPSLGIPNGETEIVKLSATEIDLWVDAITCYRSEYPKYWANKDELKTELVKFHNQYGGIRLIKSD